MLLCPSIIWTFLRFEPTTSHSRTSLYHCATETACWDQRPLVHGCPGGGNKVLGLHRPRRFSSSCSISTSISIWLMAKLVALVQSPPDRKSRSHRYRQWLDIFVLNHRINIDIESTNLYRWDARARVQTSLWSTRCWYRYNLFIY